MENTLAKILDEMSMENMYKHLAVLADDIGERLSGSAEMARAAGYIKDQLTEAGLDARIDTFPLYHSFPKEALLKVLAPETLTFDARPVCHISSTTEAGIEGDLLYIGSGNYDDYKGIDVTNKILLVDTNFRPCRPEKARIAWEKGAKALVIMNWGKPEDNVIQMGGVKSQWGNPTPDTLHEITHITVLSVTRASGEYLRDLCLKGDVRVWLRAEATREWVDANQVMGVVRGGQSNGQYILVGGHLDAWGKAAVCNSSGNAMTIELARLFQKYRAGLKRDIVFAFWDGHEIGECAGSAWYCDNHWADMANNCLASVNLDGLANKGTTVPTVTSNPELKGLYMETVAQIWQTPGVWRKAYNDDDASFYGLGVPWGAFMTEYTEEMLREFNYASHGPWLHTNDDTIDKIDKVLYGKHFEYFSHLVFQLTTRAVAPYDMNAMAEDVRQQFADLSAAAGDAACLIAELKPLVQCYCDVAAELQQRIADAGEAPSDADRLNRALMRWLRESYAFRSITDRYGRDPYGMMQVRQPMPGLYEALARLNDSPQDSHAYHLWTTKVVKEKNRIFDALNNAIRHAQDYLG